MPRCYAMLAAVVYVRAHMTSVCTSTAPSRCEEDELVFYFGSYHANFPGGSVPGSVHITSPNGATTSTRFANICTSEAREDGTCPEEDIRASCPSEVTPSDAFVSCYRANPPMPETPRTTFTITDTCAAFPATTVCAYPCSVSRVQALKPPQASTAHCPRLHRPPTALNCLLRRGPSRTRSLPSTRS